MRPGDGGQPANLGMFPGLLLSLLDRQLLNQTCGLAVRCEPPTLMGEGRALKITCTGDVVLIDFDDGVFTGREPHDLTTNGTSSIH